MTDNWLPIMIIAAVIFVVILSIIILSSPEMQERIKNRGLCIDSCEELGYIFERYYGDGKCVCDRSKKVILIEELVKE